MLEFLNHPFTWGLLVGLGLGAFGMFSVWNRQRATVKSLRKDKTQLEGSLKTHMDIHSRGSDSREKELEQYRKENENLRVTTQTMRQKPGREERIRLQIYEKTKDVMMQQAPGFAPAWVKTFDAMEQQLEQSFIGKIPLVNRLVAASGRVALPAVQNVDTSEGV
ncbi:MAG: hypothetical protein O3C57_07970 [Verrucomicrobia bacterium]|nr:hypothetical protein [Verrucomicrobiota bacterium]